MRVPPSVDLEDSSLIEATLKNLRKLKTDIFKKIWTFLVFRFLATFFTKIGDDSLSLLLPIVLSKLKINNSESNSPWLF